MSKKNKDYLKKWNEKLKKNLVLLQYKHLKKAYRIYQLVFSQNKAKKGTYLKNQLEKRTIQLLQINNNSSLK
jgi:hypothetical protein